MTTFEAAIIKQIVDICAEENSGTINLHACEEIVNDIVDKCTSFAKIKKHKRHPKSWMLTVQSL